VTINTDPKIAIVASGATQGEGLARSRADLEAAGVQFNEHDRGLLGLSAGAPVASLADKKLPASKVLALSNPALAALGYNVDPKEPRATTLDDADFARLGLHVRELPALSQSSGEVVAARTGGGVSLAVGMARVFSGLPGMSTLLSYWYHFAIMFEALFILTTIDTGTRIGRFLMQEFLGRIRPEFGVVNVEGKSNAMGGSLATLIIVGGWTYFILTGTITTLWPMFGVANQLLACCALAVGTTILLRDAKRKSYALVTALPLVFVATTTITAGVESIFTLYLPMTANAATRTNGYVSAVVTACLLVCVALIIGGSALRWLTLVRAPERRDLVAAE